MSSESEADAAGVPAVKVCGVTRADDARVAVDLGADYLGLNFYPPSPRFLEAGQAAELAAQIREHSPGVRLVGVFVNCPRRELEAIDERVGLDLLQFHGDEGDGEMAPFAERAIKVLRVRDRLDAALLNGYDHLWGMLVDSRHPGLYGGSGATWRFDSLAGRDHGVRRLFVAGGLTPDNVASAIRATRPFGIDVCSGVERAPGVKDHGLMRQLFEEIRHGQGLPAA